MIEAEEVEHRRVDVVALGGVRPVGWLVAPFVARSVGDAAFDATAGQPVGEDEGVVVASLATLGAGHAAELSGPEDQGVLEHAAVLEILDERRGTFCHAERERGVVAGDVLVGIPVATREAVVVAGPDLHKADAAFEEASGGQALAAEGILFFGDIDFFRPNLRGVIDAIAGLRLFGFLGQVEGVWCGELHLGGKLVAANAGFETRVARMRVGMGPVELAEEFESGGLSGGRDVVGRRRREVGDGLRGVDAYLCGLVLTREERGVPVLLAVGRQAADIGQHDERREVVVERAKAVAHPGADARVAWDQETGGLQEGGLAMHAGTADDIMHEGDIVHDVTDGRDDVAEHLARLTVGLEFPRRREGRARAALEEFDGFARIPLLAVFLLEEGFVVPHVDVAGCTRHEELDDALGLGRSVEDTAGGRGGEEGFLSEQAGEGDTAEAAAGAEEEVTAVHRGDAGSAMVRGVVHGQSTKLNSFRLKMSRQRLVRPCSRT